MASLNKKVSAENIEALSQMIKKIQEREDYEYFIMDIFIKNVIWEGGETFLQLFGDLLQLPDVDTDRLAEIIEKYPYRFQKDIIEQLQKKDDMIDETIYSMLELSKRENYETVMRIILDLFQNKEIEVIDKKNREVISDILMDYFSKYFDDHEPEVEKNLDTFLESFNISENTSYELQDAIVEVFCYKRRSSPNKKAFQSSIKLYPIIFSYLGRNSNNHDAIRLFLSLKKEILIKNIDYLETLLQKNEMDTSIYNVFSEFVLEEGEPFLFFYPTILTMKEEFLNESTLAKIFDKYQEKVSVFLENALVHTDERIQRRAIRVLLETRSKFSNDFIATHFTKVLHALGTFHFEHALSFYSNFARRIDFKKFLPLVFSGKESPNHSFFFRYNEFLIIDRALIYLLKEDNFEAKKHPYLANLQTSRRCHLKWIAQKKGVGK